MQVPAHPQNQQPMDTSCSQNWLCCWDNLRRQLLHRRHLQKGIRVVDLPDGGSPLPPLQDYRRYSAAQPINCTGGPATAHESSYLIARSYN